MGNEPSRTAADLRDEPPRIDGYSTGVAVCVVGPGGVQTHGGK